MDQHLARLSKTISYALRHHPEEFGLALDGEGWVTVDELLSALRQRHAWRNVSLRDIEEIIATSDKQRFELEGNRIHALYGHSLSGLLIERPAAVPPPELYHGTPRRNLERILTEGLSPMRRQHVHLSATPEIAREVGRRRDPEPVVLAVDTSAARAAGVQFLQGSGDIYLADHIPPECLSVIDRDEETGDC